MKRVAAATGSGSLLGIAPAFAIRQADTSTLCQGPEGLVVSVNLAVFNIIVDRSVDQREGRDVFKCFEERICGHQHEGDHQHERMQIGCGKSRQLSSACSAHLAHRDSGKLSRLV